MQPSVEAHVEDWRERYAARRAEYVAGEISRDLFIAHLFRLGFRGQELDAEVRLADQERA